MSTLPILFFPWPSPSPLNSITSLSPFLPLLQIQTPGFCSVNSIHTPYSSKSRIFYKFPRSVFPTESQDEYEEEDDDDDDEEAAEDYDNVVSAEVSDGGEESDDELESSLSEVLNFDETRKQRVEKLRNEVREFGDEIIDANELASIYSFRIDKFQVSFVSNTSICFSLIF